MRPTIGIIVNPRAGHDLRRLAAHAGSPNDMTRVADLRRVIVGARSAGVECVLIARDGFGLAERALTGFDAGVAVELVGDAPVRTGADTIGAAAAMSESDAQVLVVSGGDGTHRDVAVGWRDAPVVAIASGTNNAFPQMIDPTIAGMAAAIAVTDSDPLDDFVAYQARVIDIEIDGEWLDLALVNVGVIDGALPRSGSVSDADGLAQVFASVAEPWSVGASALAGVVAPTSRTDDRGVLLDLAADAPQRIRAPLAPGKVVETGLRSVSTVDVNQPVSVRGPVTFALDGERATALAEGQWASMILRPGGPRVIDIRRTFSIAVRKGRFVDTGRGEHDIGGAPDRQGHGA